MGEFDFGSLHTCTVGLYCIGVPSIEKVIFNYPATIVYWSDKTKTVVKVHDEPFEKEKGLAMAIAKKALGENYHSKMRKWLGE